MSDPVTLIVGGDSKIGQALAHALRKGGHSVLTTTRRATTASNAISLDLMNCSHWELPSGVMTVVLAAAMTNMEACRLDPAQSAYVNVHGPLTIAQTCKRRGAFLIYLSSSTVFDGQTPFVHAAAPLCPISIYGFQKATAENELQTLDTNVAIVRLTKVLEAPVSLFEQWLNALRRGGAIMPFVDVTIAPIPLTYVVNVLRLIIEARQGGIWQISGDKDITYATIADRLAKSAGVDESLVRPVTARSSGKVHEDVPPFTSLNIDRLRATFGIQPPPADWTVAAVLSKELAVEHGGSL